jgi:hypothetical protein
MRRRVSNGLLYREVVVWVAIHISKQVLGHVRLSSQAVVIKMRTFRLRNFELELLFDLPVRFRLENTPQCFL